MTWNSVENDLPPVGIAVLVTDVHGKMAIAYWTEVQFLTEDGESVGDPYLWKYLPKLPS